MGGGAGYSLHIPEEVRKKTKFDLESKYKYFFIKNNMV